MNFGKAIRIGRSISGHTQRQLAELAGVDASLISMIESGERQPSTATLKAISTALDVPVHVLTMLGAESADLRGVTEQEFRRLAESIARLVVRDEPTSHTRPARRRRTAG